MAETVQVVLDDGRRWGVAGDDSLPAEAEPYFAFLRAEGRSANAAKAYARGLAQQT